MTGPTGALNRRLDMSQKAADAPSSPDATEAPDTPDALEMLKVVVGAEPRHPRCLVTGSPVYL